MSIFSNKISIATGLTLVAIFVFSSCSNTINSAEEIDLSVTPFQRVDNMVIIQTENSVLKMRTEAPLMESYKNDTLNYDLFPRGISIYEYNNENQLEAIILADNAKHSNGKNKQEKWEAFGNVIIQNIIKQQTMQTDTLYWDRKKQIIWTHCYVKMYSKDGFLQGWGMQSDEKARHAVIKRPFNSYGVVTQDSTAILDSANFIGPFPDK